MEIVMTTVYKAKDGALFPTQEECQKYEANLPEYDYYQVHHSPDLTEGRGFYDITYIRLNKKNVEDCYKLKLINDWCYGYFGNSMAYVQGVSIIPAWSLETSNEKYYTEGGGVTWGGKERLGKRVTLKHIDGKGLTNE